MTRHERMISNHMASLSSYYGDKLNKLKFDQAQIIDKDNDSVISHSVSKKIKFVTRHLLTGDITHSTIFVDGWYDRY